MEAILTSKKQITIPEPILKKFNLRSGDTLQFVLLDDGSVFILPPKQPITHLKGILPKPPKAISLEEMEQAILEGASGGV